jgi:hypothetical protein
LEFEFKDIKASSPNPKSILNFFPFAFPIEEDGVEIERFNPEDVSFMMIFVSLSSLVEVLSEKVGWTPG